MLSFVVLRKCYFLRCHYLLWLFFVRTIAKYDVMLTKITEINRHAAIPKG